MPPGIIKVLDLRALVWYNGDIMRIAPMPTIEPAIQEAILDILPEDYDLAIELMCQLMANIILSGAGHSRLTVHDRITFHLDHYAGI